MKTGIPPHSVVPPYLVLIFHHRGSPYPYWGRWHNDDTYGKLHLLIEAETKWPPFRRHFQMHFSWMQMFGFRLKCRWGLFLRFKLTIFQHWFSNGLAPTRRQPIVWTNVGIVYWRLYASLGPDELVCMHDDVIKWKQFPRNWPFVRGIHRSRWIPHTKASDPELWCLLWSASE